MKKEFTEYTDDELISIVGKSKGKTDRQIEEAAFGELYARYDSMIHAYCKCILKDADQAEDVFQETFIRFYNSLKANKDLTNVPGYLMTIARNLCYNAKRDEKPKAPVDELEMIADNVESYEHKELLELILMATEFLEPVYRDAFIMREFDGMSYGDIAVKMKISIPNAKIRVVRAKKQVMSQLAPYLKDISEKS